MINPKTTIRDIKNMKEFAGFGNLLFPMPEYSRDSLTLDQMDRLLPYHSHIQTRTTIEVLEALKEEADLGKTIFYPIYSEEEMKRDPKKRNTGGGYTAKAIQTDKRFKAACTLSLFNSGIVRRNGFLDSQIDTIQERLQKRTK